MRASALALIGFLGLGMVSIAAPPEPLPDLPDAHGFAGPFVGVHRDALIVAGGANFPAGVPWHKTAEGKRSPKVYHDRVFVLRPGAAQWVESKIRLPKPVGYGLSVSTQEGILCIGGERREHTADATGNWTTAKFKSSDVYLIKHAPGATVPGMAIDPNYAGKPLPPLPAPLTTMAGGRVGQVVYVVGGATDAGATEQVLALDLSRETLKWEPRASIPGARTHAVGVVGNLGKGKALYVFSGRRQESDGLWNILKDGWKYLPAEDRWVDLGPIQLPGEPSRSVMAGTGLGLGFSDLLIFGGAHGEVFIENEQTLPRLIAHAKANGDEAIAEKLTTQKNDLYDFHKGFSRDILAFNTVTGRWSKRGEMLGGVRDATGPRGADRVAVVGGAVTTTAVWWQGSVVLPTGEVGPGVRSPAVVVWAPLPMTEGFGLINWLILGGYLSALVLMGLFFSKQEKSTEDFFLAGRRIPWWAAGLSIFGTSLSAITYLSMPAKSFTGNWVWLILNVGILAVAPLVVLVYLPFFRRLKVASAYQYLEQRFDLSIRLLGSASFVAFQLGRMGIVVLLPALALAAVTGMDVFTCILVMGLLSTVYTALGGMAAVIWTDVLQVVVLIGGAIAALVIIGTNLDGGLGQIFEAGGEDKFQLFNTETPWAATGIAVMALGAVISNALVPYTTDQAIIQRYLSTPDQKQAARAIWLNASLAIPAGILFLFLGSALFAFYAAHPAELASIEKPDQILPSFIATQMPAGLAGLVIAGVFAAAMSSLDSSMHSITTAVSIDWVARLGPERSSEDELNLARGMVVILGVIGTATAMLMATYEIKFLWDLFLGLIGLLGGALAGLFVLGIFTTRVRGPHAWVGAIASAGVLVYVKTQTGCPGLLYGVIGTGTCVLVGYTTSWFLPSMERPLGGLTFHTQASSVTAEASPDPETF